MGATLGSGLMVAVLALSANDDPGMNAPADCGTVALYHLLRLEGKPASVDGLLQFLPDRGPDGHSLLELRETARRHGLTLDACVIPKKPGTIQSPVLLYFKGQNAGHFLVVRPVGHTGRLVQILDGEFTPEVIDAERLMASPAWTGIALIPRPWNFPAYAALTVSVLSSLALGLRVYRRSPARRPIAAPQAE